MGCDFLDEFVTIIVPVRIVNIIVPVRIVNIIIPVRFVIGTFFARWAPFPPFLCFFNQLLGGIAGACKLLNTVGLGRGIVRIVGGGGGRFFPRWGPPPPLFCVFLTINSSEESQVLGVNSSILSVGQVRRRKPVA